LLLLDEPTNDLDIPTLEILEESLLEFEGALVLVTHDRYLLDRVSTVVLGLDGSGKAERFADYSQWAAESARAQAKPKATRTVAPAGPGAEPPRKKLSYIEGREYESIERRLSEMEDAIHQKRAALQEAALKDPRSLEQIHREIEASQQEIDLLYARWVELEEKVR
jgi:ATP-binding cassette subfamily F protein uup